MAGSRSRRSTSSTSSNGARWLNSVEMIRDGESVQAEVAGPYRVSSPMAIRDALVAGSGIGLCPDWLVAERLRRFPGLHAPAGA